ncbi:MAG TPA: hypothetical protein VE961_00135 [Pyrinomonadaceae bacterium]|nr:hypothetical protein [Pyrinomonadaceae bacterium]
MLRYKFSVLWIVIFAALPGFSAEPDSTALPAGAMQNKARTACTTCHEASIVVQQRLNKAAWTKEVDKMVKWGATLNASDRDALIEYLSSNFPPEKAPYVAPRSARSKH